MPPQNTGFPREYGAPPPKPTDTKSDLDARQTDQMGAQRSRGPWPWNTQAPGVVTLAWATTSWKGCGQVASVSPYSGHSYGNSYTRRCSKSPAFKNSTKPQPKIVQNCDVVTSTLCPAPRHFLTTALHRHMRIGHVGCVARGTHTLKTPALNWGPGSHCTPKTLQCVYNATTGVSALGAHMSPSQGSIRREGTSEAAPELIRQAVGEGAQGGWGRLLSVTNAIEAGTCR